MERSSKDQPLARVSPNDSYSPYANGLLVYVVEMPDAPTSTGVPSNPRVAFARSIPDTHIFCPRVKRANSAPILKKSAMISMGAGESPIPSR